MKVAKPTLIESTIFKGHSRSRSNRLKLAKDDADAKEQTIKYIGNPLAQITTHKKPTVFLYAS